jgi:outer membrane protein OmpA-like peptidoglycan-associated protein
MAAAAAAETARPGGRAMPGRVTRASGACGVALAALVGAVVALDGAGARAQQAAPPPSAEQLRQAIEEIRRRLARPPEGQPPAEAALAGELKAANARIAELNETLARLRSERDTLRADLEQARGESDRLAETVNGLDGRAQALEQRLAELVEGRARDLERLNAELVALKGRAERAERSAGSDAQRAAQLEAALAEAKGAGETATRELAAARQRAEQAEQQGARQQSETAALAARLEAVQGQLASARGEAQAGARRVEELGSRLQAAEADAARLQREVEELRTIAATSVGEMQSLGEQLLRVLADNQTLLQTLEQVRAARELTLAELGAARRDAELYAAEAARLRGQTGGAERPAPPNGTVAALARLEAAPETPERGPPPDGAALRTELAALRAVEAADGAVVTVIEGTAFQFGSEQLTENAGGSLLRVARLIDLVQPSRVRLVGHTDSQGDDEANRRLSQRRAQTVRDWLVRNRGLPAARLVVEGRGEDQPIASNDTPEGRRANRRVEVILDR